MASITKRPMPDPKGGRDRIVYEVRWKEGGKHRAKSGFKLKHDAKEFLRRIENEIASGVHVAREQSLTVRAVCDAYLRLCEDKVRDGRIGDSRAALIGYAVNKSIVPFFKETSFADVTVKQVGDFYRWMCRDGGLSPRTAKERVFDFKSIEEFALEQGYAMKTVAPLALRSLRGVAKPKVKKFTAEQALAVIRAASERKFRGQDRTFAMANCFVHLAVFCGLRIGEIKALIPGNVDLARGVIHVRHNLTNWDVLKGPKTRAGIRDEPMPPHVAELLREWTAKWVVPEKRGLLFRTKTGGLITPTNMHHNMWHPILRSAGLYDEDGDQFHFHALRHFSASWRVHMGMSPVDVARSLGHSHFDTTLQVYAHPVFGQHHGTDVAGQHATQLLALDAAKAGPVIDAEAIAAG